MPTTCRALGCRQNSRLPALLLYPSMFDLSVIYRPTRSAVHLQSDSSPVVVHLQFTCSCTSVPCSPSAALLAVHLPVLGGLSSLTVKLKLSTPSTRVLHISSILGFCHSHSSTLHRQLAPSCSDDHLHTPTSYSRG